MEVAAKAGLTVYIYIYIYMFVCVCVCACVRVLGMGRAPVSPLNPPHVTGDDYNYDTILV